VLSIRRALGGVLGGLILFAAFPDVGWWITAIIAAAVLFVVLHGARARVGFIVGWLFGVAFFLPHLWWAYVAVGVVPWLALSVAEGLSFALVGLLFARIVRSGRMTPYRWVSPLVFATLWVGAEQLRAAVPFGGFPWGRTAFAMVDSSLARMAWLGGVPLVSLVTVLLGASVAAAVLALREGAWLWGLGTAVAVVLVALAPVMLPLDGQSQSGTLSVAWAQGNLANRGLDSFSRAREVTQNHLVATQALMAAHPDASVDLMVWPENSSDIDPRTDPETAWVLTQAAQAVGAPVLFGTNDYSPPGGRYNVSLVWLPSGTVLPGVEYRKQVPAAFAEYIPLRSIVRNFSSEVDRVTTDVVAGDIPARLSIPIATLGRDVVVGPVICFEVAYDWVSRQAVREGAEFLAVQTNNATFGVTAESTQQLAMSRLRAIETGRATLQVSTVGVSAVISPTGQVLDRADLFTQAGGIAQVPLRTMLTPASHWGGPLALLYDVISAIVALWCLVSRPEDATA